MASSRGRFGFSDRDGDRWCGRYRRCLIRNMSISRATLDVTKHDIPERFNLAFKADGLSFPVTLSGDRRNGSVWPSTRRFDQE
jgi:hypothetical protein